jgi:competence protein ComEA
MKKLLLGLFLSVFTAIPALAAVNLNTATQAELEAVKGIGPSKAKAIIVHREKNGAFKSVDDLAKVKGFGKASVEKLKGQFEVPAEAAKK